MAALDIIGVDLEFRLGVNLGLVAEQQVVIGLVRIRAVGTFMHDCFAVPDAATSRQEYRGILNGRCRCVWNGKAIVHEGADGTDADQANHNLLLSDKAEIDAKPELEIYTDDVKCSHGTTVGQLDETALFYLRSRGLDRNSAIQVLTHAFAAGLVSRVPVDAARDAVSALIEQRLEELAVRIEDEAT